MRWGFALGLMALGAALGEGFPGTAGVGWGAVELHAQAPEAAARARYIRAREDFMALQEQTEDLQARVAQSAGTLHSHREAGNFRASEDVFTNEFLGASTLLVEVNVQASGAKMRLDEARRDLLRLLRAREQLLLQELDRVPPPSRAREEEVNRLVVQIRQEVNQLEREREPIAEAGFRPVPSLVALPGDGPVELRAKAAFLERVMTEYVTVMTLVDEEIRARENTLRVQRTFQDSRDGIIRFDGDRPPGTGPGTRVTTGQADAGRAGDMAVQVLSFYELDVSEQIERLRSVRMQAEEARDEAQQRAADLRRLAVLRGGGTG